MKILREETLKERLPVSFLTDFMSKGWEEIGYLNEAIRGISTEFSETAKVEKILQDLIDAYLVCIGQLELYLKDEDYVEYPENDKKPELANAAEVVAASKPAEIAKTSVKPETLTVEADNFETMPEKDDFSDYKIDDSALADTRADIVAGQEIADFFVDFDEPDMSQPRLTDDELYGQEDSEFEQAKLRNRLRG